MTKKPGKTSRYQIDQSGKVEDTAKNTVLAYSNGSQYAVLIPKKVKRQIQEIFRRQGMTRLFVVRLFSLGIFYLIRNFKTPIHVTIDTEYPGKEKIIKSILEDLLKSQKKPSHYIHFSRIGNTPRVHYAAKNVYDGKIKPDFILNSKEILKHQKSRWAFKRVSYNSGRRSAPALVTKYYQK